MNGDLRYIYIETGSLICANRCLSERSKFFVTLTSVFKVRFWRCLLQKRPDRQLVLQTGASFYYLPTIIFINTSIRLSREIFTLAHEIGHAILHLDGEQPFIDNNATIAGGNIDEKEQEANYFAACLLMPSDEVDRFIDLELPDFEKNGLSCMDIARMISEFNVSYDMALNRLESLGKIDGKQKTQLETERTERRVGNLLKSIGGNSRLNIASNEVVIPYEYIDYVIYNYNHNAIPRETLEKTLECYQLTIEDISDVI